jgi:hypothetical protein
MRSAIGPLSVLIGMAMTVVLVLLLFVNLGTRSELEEVRGELDALRASADAAVEPEIGTAELVDRLDEIDAAVDELLLATGGAGQPTGPDDATAITDRLDEILDRVEALDARVDEICDNVPVC